jgi:CRP/FNR family transcriptional regulator
MALKGNIFPRTCPNCPCKCEIFKLLTDKELEKLNNNRTETKFNAGELIFKQGTPTNMVVWVSKGLVKIFIEGVEGKDLILSLVKSTQFISGPELYCNKVYNYSVAALEYTECCYVDEHIFKELIWNNRKFSEAFIHELSRRSINTMNLLVSSTQKKMNGRVAEGLLYLSKLFESDKFNMVLNKKEFGDLTSMTRESAIRILNLFKEEGIIDNKGSLVEIKDMNKLINICNIG